MDRELLLYVFLVVLGGVTLIVAGLRRTRIDAADPAIAEARGWRAILAPLVPASIAIGAVIGWAVFEPANAEVMPLPWFVASGPLAVLWLRALVRAVRAVRTSECVSADTHGLLSPRIRVSPRFAAALDEPALAAAIAHEQAHARHRDPLRIWIAQLVTDLQGTRRARERLMRWLAALELARDDEARRQGVDGEDLAAAVVAAARLHAAPGALAHLGGSADALRARIDRLLRPLGDAEVIRTRAMHPLVAAAFASAVVVGALGGEHVVRLLLAGSP